MNKIEHMKYTCHLAQTTSIETSGHFIIRQPNPLLITFRFYSPNCQVDLLLPNLNFLPATCPGFARVVEHMMGCHQFDASNMWIRFTTLLEVF